MIITILAADQGGKGVGKMLRTLCHVEIGLMVVTPERNEETG